MHYAGIKNQSACADARLPNDSHDSANLDDAIFGLTEMSAEKANNPLCHGKDCIIIDEALEAPAPGLLEVSTIFTASTPRTESTTEEQVRDPRCRLFVSTVGTPSFDYTYD